jgi:hypothetical protein
MRTLPAEMIRGLTLFAPLFSRSVFRHVQVLVARFSAAPGKRRTVASALRAVGLEEERCFCRYHRVLSRASWSQAERRAVSCWDCSHRSLCARRTVGVGRR